MLANFFAISIHGPIWKALSVATSASRSYHSPFTVHRSPFTIHHSPFTIPFTIPLRRFSHTVFLVNGEW
jgi:hypothetical protein